MNLQNLGVQEMNASEIKTIDGGYECYPGGCNYSGGGMQWEGPVNGPQPDPGMSDEEYFNLMFNFFGS